MNKIYYKSDFDFILKIKDCRGEVMGWPDFDWTARLWTSQKVNAFIASCKGGKAVNCFNDNGQIHIVADTNHGLGIGQLQVEFTAEIPNVIYPDGYERVVTAIALDIELTRDALPCCDAAEVELLLPIIKGDKGDPFTYEDFTPQQIAELQKPALDAAADANVAANNATAKALMADTAAKNANAAATIANEAAAKAETSTANLEATDAEVRAAETARVNEFATIKQEASAATTAATEAATNANSAIEQLPTQLAAKQDKLTVVGDLNLTDNSVLSLTDMAKKRLFIDLWNAACGIWGGYNEETRFFELNGLTDITYEEAKKIYNLGPLIGDSLELYSGQPFLTVRTWLPSKRETGLGYYSRFLYPYTSAFPRGNFICNLNPYDREADLYINDTKERNISHYSISCRYFIGVMNVTYYTGRSFFALGTGSDLVEHLLIRGLKVDMQMRGVSKIDYESMAFLVSEAINTAAITITVHPNVYAKLTGDETNAAYANLTDEEKAQWTGLLETAVGKNISFATV